MLALSEIEIVVRVWTPQGDVRRAMYDEKGPLPRNATLENMVSTYTATLRAIANVPKEVSHWRSWRSRGSVQSRTLRFR